MALQGVPQYVGVRSFLWSGSGTSEVDEAALNGQDKANASTNAPYSNANVTQTITAGPTTAGPVIVVYNGIVWALPFNVAVSAPKFVFDALDASQWTHA